MLDAGYLMLDIGYWILDFGFWILDIGYWILDPIFEPETLSRKLSGLNFEL